MLHTKKIAIVGSKSLDGLEDVYRMIQRVIEEEVGENSSSLVVLNGGEDGVDTMAGEVALSLGHDYMIVPLRGCIHGCNPGKKYCFDHSFRPRSKEIAEKAEKIFRIYDEACGTSTCEVTASFGDELGRKVTRIPVDVLSISR